MEHSSHDKGQHHYGRLAIELTLDFIVRYLVMYTMIAALAHFHFNLNNVYMTMMMVAPMTLIMLISMRSMFPSPRLNIMIVGLPLSSLSLASSPCEPKPALATPSSCAR